MTSAVSPNPTNDRVVRHVDYYITGGDVVFRVCKSAIDYHVSYQQGPIHRWKICYIVSIAIFLHETLRFSGKNFPTLRLLASSPKDLPIATLFTSRTPSKLILSDSFGYSTTRESSMFCLSIPPDDTVLQQI
jgi:hypothetical protein